MTFESSEQAFEEASISEAAFLEKIVATTAAAGAEGAIDEGLPIANHLFEGSLMDQGPSSFLGNSQGCPVAQDGTSSTRQNYLNLSTNLT